MTSTLRPLTVDIAEAIRDYDPGDIADTLGVTRRTVNRWIRNGAPEPVADRIACKILGRNPQEVWGAAWADLIDATWEDDDG